LPVDITFVDKEDRVRYFSQSKERIFPRTKAVIGRKVQQCHPQKSLHVVEEILSTSFSISLRVQEKVRNLVIASPSSSRIETVNDFFKISIPGGKDD